MAKPSIYPTGVTIYDKEKAYNGYTLFNSEYGATVVDMNGRMVKSWDGVREPMKPMPNGQVLASVGKIPAAWAGAAACKELVQLDWDGHVVWSYRNNFSITNTDGSTEMVSGHHHDFEKEGCPAGYYTPAMEPKSTDGGCLLLTHQELFDLAISDKKLLDERIIEVDADGNLLWEWNAHEHIDEMGLDEAARKSLFYFPMTGGDWIHMNAIATLGPNKYYDAGDGRFEPENIICSSRQLNEFFIIDKKTGKLVWRMGPDFSASPELAKVGQIIGQHFVHMIPKGLPGEGHILVFDNGSFGGYGTPTAVAPVGYDIVRRHYSRVLEIDPVTCEVVWEYMKAVPMAGGGLMEFDAQDFFSPYISSAQRLPNGNTFIDQGADGVMIEVTPDKETVWEFINPIYNRKEPKLTQGAVYRAYRLPYSWIPQLPQPQETSIEPLDVTTYRVPGSCGLFDGGTPEELITPLKR